MASESVEYRTLIVCNDKLTTMFKLSPVSIANELLAEGLIPPEVHGKVLAPGLDDVVKATGLVTCVRDIVKVCPGKYHGFMAMPMFKEKWLKQLHDAITTEYEMLQKRVGSCQEGTVECMVEAEDHHEDPHEMFRCPCRVCSLESYLEVGCPKSNSDSFPYLDSSNLDEDDKEDLTQKLSQDTSDMIMCFANLFDEICVSLEKQGVSVQRVAMRALSLGAYESQIIQKPLLSEDEKELRNSKTIDEAFLVLRPHTSFFNFELLKHITDSRELCSDSDRRRMDEYISKFNAFCQRKVFEVSPAAVGQPTSNLKKRKRKAFVILMTKHEAEPNLLFVNAAKQKIAKLLKVNPSTLHLHRIDEGSIILVFSVPNFVAKKLFPLKPSMVAELKDEGFLVLTPPATEEPHKVVVIEKVQLADMTDPHSKSNFDQVIVKSYDWKVEVDFSAKKLVCSLTLHAKTLQDGCTQMLLDMCDLSVTSVVSTDTSQILSFEEQTPEGAFGSVLAITLPSTCANKGADVNVTIAYETKPTAKAGAVQWLDPEQTAGKKHPYLFTQCQAIHARSMLPCQDTPSVKTEYTAEVNVPSELTALMSAERLGEEPHSTQPGKKLCKFQQKTPIPSYLIALVVGALDSRQVGPKSRVWCEREMVEQAAWDFSETGRILTVAEEIVGPYIWGPYDLLILPPSFPYGGMENPCLTFVSPTVLSSTTEGEDKSQAIVIVAHEVSHSWTGNLVTNRTWEEFWLNEGFTTYLERKIVAKLYGEQERHLRYINGWKSLQETVDRFTQNNEGSLTALRPTLTHVHPDDAFSVVPYEKGSAFLFYLETLLGGPGSLDEFLRAYVNKFKFSTVTSVEWKDFFLEFFDKEAREGVFDKVEWDKWFYEPGMPPFTPTYDKTLADTSIALADRWSSVAEVSDSTLSQFSPGDLNELSSSVVQEFLSQLLTKDALSVEVIQAMDNIYHLSKSENSEIKFRWLRLCLKSKLKEVFPAVVDFVTKQGRMKFVRPLYRDLYACDEEGRQLAVSTFQAHRQFYHSVAANQLTKDLQLN